MLYDSEFVHNLLPQKAPFAFVDEIIDLQEGGEPAADGTPNNPKSTIVEYKGKRPVVGERVFLAEGACLIGDVTIGNDSSVFYNAVLRADLSSIVVGERTNIQDNVSVHLSLDQGVVIGNEVTVGHNAILHACTIDDNVLIGMGAIVMDGAHIKKNCVIGAGAIVTQGKEFPENSLVVGSPARVVRELTDDEIRKAREGVLHYLDAKDELLKHV